MEEENRIPEEYIIREGNETGVTMDYIEELIRSGLRNSGVMLRAAHTGDTHPDVPRPEDIDTGERTRIFKGVKQVTLDVYESLTEEERQQYVFFVREESGATFGFVGIGNLKYTMVPEDIRGVDNGYFDCPEPVPPTPPDYHLLPLTIESLEDGDVIWNLGASRQDTVKYSVNDGAWIPISNVTVNGISTITVSEGDTVKFVGTNSEYTGCTFSATTMLFNVSGNILSIIRESGFEDIYTLETDFMFRNFFCGCSKLVSAENLILQADTLSSWCYTGMFSGCTMLERTPELPASNLASDCYEDMFRSCTSLVECPELLSTNLADNCYMGMFWGCTSLEIVHELPATVLERRCYSSMFRECTGLTTAQSILPADRLKDYCYSYMYQGCRSLTSVPELPATIAARGCMNSMFKECTSLVRAQEIIRPLTLFDTSCTDMFRGCTSLEVAPELPATTLGQSTYGYMFYGCRNLRTGPSAIPAITFPERCCQSMFEGCSSLLAAPEFAPTTLNAYCCRSMLYGCSSMVTGPVILPATTLPLQCYSYMFFRCTSLTNMPSLSNVSEIGDNSCSMMFYECGAMHNDGVNNSLENFAPISVGPSGCTSMFAGCRSITTVPNALPAETASTYCYASMFYGCQEITQTPVLCATTLMNYCYQSMFATCPHITQAPELPVMSLALGCYKNMFGGCSSLTSAPELPATALTNECYYSMFINCTGLTQAPDLPATTLTPSCYYLMFSNCRSLSESPVLPATVLVNDCYHSMFHNCLHLTHIICLAEDISATNCTTTWVQQVSTVNGVFEKSPNMSNWTTGVDGIPNNWTVVDIQ